jgi:TM2 domain-containing membrane protein YozV
LLGKLRKDKDQYRDPMLAATASAIVGFMSFLGFGQFYVRKFLRGGILLVSGLILRLLTLGDSGTPLSAQARTFLPPLPWWLSLGLRLSFLILWLWSVFDAHKQAKLFNSKLLSSEMARV